jgi:serralysin
MPNIFETADAAANTSTSYTLTTGQIAQGTIATNNEHDWYRVDLAAGQTYTFALVGTGINNLQNPYLRLYAPGGSTIVAQDDSSLQGNNSIVTYTAASSGSYYIDAGSAGTTGTGQYGVSFTAGSRASFDVPMGAGVIDTDLSWSNTPGTGATVTYGYRNTNNGLEGSFFKITAVQKTTIEQILQMFSEVCNLTFSPVNTGAPGSIAYTDSATILFSNYNANDGSGAYAYYPGSTAANAYPGDVWLNTSSGNVSTTSLPIGSYSYSTIAHELGHAVGLSHPGKYNAAPGVSITYGANAQFTQDSEQYSLMSYFDEVNTGATFGSGSSTECETLMLFDILALQNIYGANTATRAGDTVYGFGATAGISAAYNFQTNTSAAVCIWDGAGTDTLNLSGYSQAQVINLNPGTFSNVGGLTANVSIAYNCTIENATGGSGADRFHLSVDNVNNLIIGGTGTDTAHVTYTYGSGYTVSGTSTNFTISGAAGSDSFQGVEFVVFASGLQVSAVDLTANLNVSDVTISDVTITEGNAGTKVATFTVTRTGGVSAFSVNYATANGTATAGSDYLGAAGTVNFGVGENTKTISVTINGDTAVEASETFVVNLSGATGGAVITDTQGAGTITDDDAAPVIGAVGVADLTITEGNAGTQLATFVVTRTGGTAAFTVNYATANGSAAAGSDYAAASGTLSFAAGATSQNVSVTIFGDTAVEPNETFFLNLISLTAGGTLADAQGLATIVDNDSSGDDFRDGFADTTAPLGSVAVNTTATGNLETVGDHDWFAIALTAGQTVTIDLEGIDTLQGTLEDPFLALYGPAGAFIVQNDDGGSGINSQLVYTPTASGTYYIDAGAYDDDGAGTYRVAVTGAVVAAGSVTITDVSISEGNAGTQIATFTVARTGGSAAFAVDFATANNTAFAGSDYVATSGTLNFGAGVNTQTISVTISGDTFVEADETFFVNLSGATNGATIADGQGLGTIIDNDSNPDDFADSWTDLSAPFGAVNVGGAATGSLETTGDRDWFQVSLIAGQLYTINVAGPTLTDPYMYFYNSVGQQLRFDDDSGPGLNPQISYRATATGPYYIAAAAYDDQGAGSYTVSVALADDYAGDASTSGELLPGGTAEGTIETLADKDWFRVQLSAGYTYTFTMLGADSAAGTLVDPFLSLFDSFGKKQLVQDDDSGFGADAQFSFLAKTSGTFYLAATAFNSLYTGSYDVTLTKSPGVTITGTNFAELISASSGVGGVFPTAFADTINGLVGDDDIYGGDGDDTLIGGKGIDWLFGEDGNDIIVATGKDDQYDLFDGGPGTDTLRVSGTAILVQNGFDALGFSIEVWEGNGKAVQGTASGEVFDFSGLISATGIAYVDGLAGNDTLIGTSAGEDLRGGVGDDTLEGRGGNDRLSGAKGNDHFNFGTGFGNDIIVDFTPGLGLGDVMHFQPGTFADFTAVQFAMTTVDGDSDGKADDTRITVDAFNSVTLLNLLGTRFVADDFDLV